MVITALQDVKLVCHDMNVNKGSDELHIYCY